jgi:signal peptidase I
MIELMRTWRRTGQQRMGKMWTLGRRIWREWRLAVIFIVFVVVPVKSSLADWNWVPTGSMNPTILEGDLIYVNKIAYDLRVPLTLHRLASWSEPQRGDVVVCLSPEDGTRLVKRIVGKPGDTVQMSGNILLLNDRPLAYRETGRDCPVHLSGDRVVAGVLALENLDRTVHPVVRIPGLHAMRSFGPVVVPDGCYFVLGDNRDLSRDSRYFGVVPRESILGRARAVVLSFDITDKYQPRIGRFLTRLR